MGQMGKHRDRWGHVGTGWKTSGQVRTDWNKSGQCQSLLAILKTKVHNVKRSKTMLDNLKPY